MSIRHPRVVSSGWPKCTSDEFGVGEHQGGPGGRAGGGASLGCEHEGRRPGTAEGSRDRGGIRGSTHARARHRAWSPRWRALRGRGRSDSVHSCQRARTRLRTSRPWRSAASGLLVTLVTAASATRRDKHLKEVSPREEGGEEQGSGSRGFWSRGADRGQGLGGGAAPPERAPRALQSPPGRHDQPGSPPGCPGCPGIELRRPACHTTFHPFFPPASGGTFWKAIPRLAGPHSRPWSFTQLSINPQTAILLSQRLMFRSLARGKGEAKSMWEKVGQPETILKLPTGLGEGHRQKLQGLLLTSWPQPPSTPRNSWLQPPTQAGQPLLLQRGPHPLH